jgi:hypothetical protein
MDELWTGNRRNHIKLSNPMARDYASMLQAARWAGDEETGARLHEFAARYWLSTNTPTGLATQRAVDPLLVATLLELHRGQPNDLWLDNARSLLDASWGASSAEAARWGKPSDQGEIHLDVESAILGSEVFATPDYLDRAAKAMVGFCTSHQQSNGLFYISADTPCAWSRLNGSAGLGMARLLGALEESDERRDSLEKQFQALMTAAVEREGTNYLWSIDLEDQTTYGEASGSGLLVAALHHGLRLGLLDEAEFATVARSRWIAFVEAAVGKSGKIYYSCITPNDSVSVEGIRNLPAQRGERVGQAVALIGAMAVVE